MDVRKIPDLTMILVKGYEIAKLIKENYERTTVTMITTSMYLPAFSGSFTIYEGKVVSVVDLLLE